MKKLKIISNPSSRSSTGKQNTISYIYTNALPHVNFTSFQLAGPEIRISPKYHIPIPHQSRPVSAITIYSQTLISTMSETVPSQAMQKRPASQWHIYHHVHLCNVYNMLQFPLTTANAYSSEHLDSSTARFSHRSWWTWISKPTGRRAPKKQQWWVLIVPLGPIVFTKFKNWSYQWPHQVLKQKLHGHCLQFCSQS